MLKQTSNRQRMQVYKGKNYLLSKQEEFVSFYEGFLCIKLSKDII